MAMPHSVDHALTINRLALPFGVSQPTTAPRSNATEPNTVPGIQAYRVGSNHCSVILSFLSHPSNCDGRCFTFSPARCPNAISHKNILSTHSGNSPAGRCFRLILELPYSGYLFPHRAGNSEGAGVTMKSRLGQAKALAR